MKKISLALAAALLVLCSDGWAQDRSIKFETGSFEAVVAKAKKEKKPIFMDAYTTWCGPCKWMDKNVFTNNEVADFYNKNFIAYKADMEKGEGITLAKKFNVKAYPSLLYLNSAGEMVHSSIGAREPDSFILLGKEALNPETQYASLHKKYTNGERKPEFMALYIAALNSAGLDMKEPLEAYYKTQKPADLTSPINWKIIKAVAYQGESSLVNHFENNNAAYAQKFGADSVNLLLSDIYFSRMQQAARKGDQIAYTNARKKFDGVKVNRDENIAKQYSSAAEQMDISFLEKSGDIKAYAEGVTKLVENNLMESAGGLNNYAWAFYEKVDDKTYLAKAEGWAKKAVELEPSYEYMDTHAAVLYKLGKKNEAKTVAEKAIALGKKENKEVADTEALLKKINAMK